MPKKKMFKDKNIYNMKGEPVFVDSKAQRRQGKELRSLMSREAHAEYKMLDRDPVAILAHQDEMRLPELRELRRERMAQSRFTFYRGSARLMAHDLAQGADTGLHTVICGDAHLANLGLYASPERRLAFDLNDFDEAAIGPWEWDVKRLATSFILGTRDRVFNEDAVKRITLECVESYRETLNHLATLSALERYYFNVGDDAIARFGRLGSQGSFAKSIDKAVNRDSAHAVARFAVDDEMGRKRFLEDPPVLTHIDSVVENRIVRSLNGYLETANPAIVQLMKQYSFTDLARRVVGVGSVGTRCFIALFTCTDHSYLVLQVKQAMPSVVSEFADVNENTLRYSLPVNNGNRVISYQQILQAVSDPFLGSFSVDGRDFYVRQFRDMKGSIDLDKLTEKEYWKYANACGVLLARAHAQSFTVQQIAGYMGKSDAFDHAILTWGLTYAEQVDLDYQRFIEQ